MGGSGLGDAKNLYTELIPFNGDLYAWTSNYVTGQQVRRATCPAARNVILMIGDGMVRTTRKRPDVTTVRRSPSIVGPTRVG